MTARGEGRVDSAGLRELRHELRTPINHIMGYSELLLEEAQETGLGELVPDLEAVHAAGKRSLELINSALDSARLGENSISLLSLRGELQTPLDAIIASITGLQEQAAAGHHEEIVPDLQRIDAAARHVLALVAAPTFGWQGEAGDEQVEPPSNQALADDGRRGSEGSALRKTSVLAGAATCSLLVVDDNESNRDMLARRLERLGYGVSLAEHGRQALEMIAAASFDLVLLDIMMPELNGYEVLERLKADTSTRDIPVIVISALDELSSVVRCIEAGAEDYLPKPFDPVLLRARVGACLEKKRLRDQELEYLRNVARVTDAAAAVEVAAFDPFSLDDVAGRTDGLGQLARVFQRMAREVYAREQRLQQQVAELKIEIDQSKKAREVAAITETDYFQRLQERAKRLRQRNDG